MDKKIVNLRHFLSYRKFEIVNLFSKTKTVKQKSVANLLGVDHTFGWVTVLEQCESFIIIIINHC